MPLDGNEWRSKLIAVDYPNAASIGEAALMHLLFRPSTQRKKLIAWISQKIADRTGFNGSDLAVFSSFVFGSKETLNGFIEGTLGKNAMEIIWNSVLNDLRPTSPICGDKELRSAALQSGCTTMTLEQLEEFGITGPPPDVYRQPDILDRVDDIVNRAEALLVKHSTVDASSAAAPLRPHKPLGPLTTLVEDAANLNRKFKTDDSAEDMFRRIEPSLTKMSAVAVDLEEFVNDLRTMKAAMENLESRRIENPLLNLQDD